MVESPGFQPVEHKKSSPYSPLDKINKHANRASKFFRAGILATGLHFGLGAYLNSEAEKLSRERRARADLIVTNDIGLIEPEWSTDPEELQNQVAKIVTNERGKTDIETAQKIDMGFLIIAKMAAEGQIDQKTAQETRALLQKKRADYKAMSKTNDPIEVLYEITQEHRRYDPRIHDMVTFLQKGEGNCSAAMAGFAAIAQGVYPNLEFKIQHFTGTYEGHVRLIVNIEKNWFAIERGGLTPITLEPGSAVQDLSSIPLVIGEKPTGTVTIVPGESAEIPPPDPTVQAEKIKLRAENKPGYDVGNTLLQELPVQPTASYTDDNNIAQPESKPREIVHFDAAEKKLASENPKVHQERQKIRRVLWKKMGLYKPLEVRLETKMGETKMQAEMKRLLELTPNIRSLEEENERGGVPEEIEKWKEIDSILEKISQKDKALTEFLRYLKNQPDGKELLFDIRLYYALLTKKGLGTSEKTGSDYSQAEQKEIVYNFAHRNAWLSTENLMFAEPDGLINSLTADKVREKEIKEIAAKLAATDRIVDKINLSGVEMTSFKEEWFERMRFNPNVGISFSFNSLDTDLSFLDRADIKSITNISIKAPIADFSILAKKMGNSVRQVFIRLENISPFADLQTMPALIDPHFEIVDLPPGVEIPPHLTGKTKLIFENNTQLDFGKVKKEIAKMSEIEILCNEKFVNIEGLRNNESLTKITLENPYNDFSKFATLKNLQEIYIRYTSDAKHHLTLADLINLSKLIPTVAIYVENPDYDSEADPKGLTGQKEIEIKNGEINYNFNP